MSRDKAHEPTAPKYLHEVNLGEMLSPEQRQSLLFEHRNADVIRAVLQALRDAAAECRQTAMLCAKNRSYVEKAANGQVITGTMDDPNFHTGAGQACEDEFWELWRWMHPVKESAPDTGGDADEG